MVALMLKPTMSGKLSVCWHMWTCGTGLHLYRATCPWWKAQQRDEQVKNKKIQLCKTLFFEIMWAFGIEDVVLELLYDVHWTMFAIIEQPVYLELVREFYVAFSFDNTGTVFMQTLKHVYYRLWSHKYEIFVSDFNVLMSSCFQHTRRAWHWSISDKLLSNTSRIWLSRSA